MATVNQRLLDDQIDHAVYLKGYTTSVVNRIMAILNRADKAIAAELVKKLASLNPDTFTMQRLEGMLVSVRTINAEAYKTVETQLKKELREFAEFEVDYQQRELATLVPQISLERVSFDAVYAGAMSRPFQGNLLKGFLDDLGEKKAGLIRRTIADGFVQGKTTDQIVRELRGTRAKGFTDGVLEITRRDATAVVRTALSHTSAFAQQKVYDANEDLIKGYVWVATLDTRTTSECRMRDGKEYDKEFKPVGHDLPWRAGPGLLHWNCRSRRSPITKSWKELGLNLEELEPEERASMDGTVPASMSYPAWLEKQSAERQDEILGPTRGKLLREGGLAPEDMYSAKGKTYTLEELRERHARAFTKAGL